MPIALTDYLEKTENISPSSVGFSLQSGGRATYPVQVLAPTALDLTNAITDILGSIQTKAGDGRIQRTLPLAHPQFPFLYASNISAMRGFGKYTKTAAAKKLEATSLPYFALYDQYELTVEFTPRPYAVLSDPSITLEKKASYYDVNGVKQTARFAYEWYRYTDFQIHPQPETITAQQGELVFVTQSGTLPPVGAHGAPLSSMARKTLANSLIKFTWYQVPYRYVDSPDSYLEKYQGCINQNDWYGWDAGSLLYLNYLPKRYTPPIPQLEQWTGSAYSTEKWCDIEFTFLLTNRTGTDLPTALSNKNWLAAGHNLMPWANDLRNCYYVGKSVDNPESIWPSIPFEMLFTDPDV